MPPPPPPPPEFLCAAPPPQTPTATTTSRTVWTGVMCARHAPLYASRMSSPVPAPHQPLINHLRDRLASPHPPGFRRDMFRGASENLCRSRRVHPMYTPVSSGGVAGAKTWVAHGQLRAMTRPMTRFTTRPMGTGPWTGSWAGGPWSEKGQRSMECRVGRHDTPLMNPFMEGVDGTPRHGPKLVQRMCMTRSTATSAKAIFTVPAKPPRGRRKCY